MIGIEIVKRETHLGYKLTIFEETKDKVTVLDEVTFPYWVEEFQAHALAELIRTLFPLGEITPEKPAA